MSKHLMIRTLLSLALGAAVLTPTSPSHALSLLLTSDDYWFDPTDRTPVDADVEIMGLSSNEIGSILRLQLAQNPDLLAKISLRSIQPLNGVSATQIDLSRVSHAELLQIKHLLADMKKLGAKPVRSELPLVPRVLNVENNRLLLKFAASVSGVRSKDIEAILKAEKKSKTSGKPVVFRYNVEDPIEMFGDEYAAELRHANRESVVGQLPTGLIGRMPLMIDGESAMFHSRHYHAHSLVARYNPGLINQHIQYFITTNKYVEFLFWEKFAKGIMPETRLLKDFNTSGPVNELRKEMNAKFPQGWVLKGTNESNTALFIVTEKTDLEKAIDEYRKSDFDSYEKRIRSEYAGADEDTIFHFLQKHPAYFGWKVTQYLKKPHTAVVQEKIDIDREYRADVFMGKVVGPGVTIDRFIEERNARGANLKPSTKEQFSAADRWVQGVIDRMSGNFHPWLRWMHGGWDFAKRKGGSFALIESNAGNESSRFYDETQQIRIVNALLKRYKSALEKGEIAEGLSPEEQMKFIVEFAKEQKIDIKAMYPDYRFKRDAMLTTFKPIEVSSDFHMAKPSERGFPLGTPSTAPASARSCRQIFN